MTRKNILYIYSQVPYRNNLFMIFLIIIIFFFLKNFPKKRNLFFNENLFNYINKTKKEKNYFNIKFKYEEYESYLVTNIEKRAGWMLDLKEAYFINGLIRKLKPKNCLEIGVATGGSSILILNAIKDIKNSSLVSLDLNNQLYIDYTKKVGYRVNEYFPELTKNWKLFTGDQPHKFLVELNMKFDLLFLDSAHLTPGELINFIEALPFLNENSIVIIHDILWHCGSQIKIFPSNINLFPAIYGDKLLLRKNGRDIGNIGAVFLYPNQKSHYLDYFLLLLNLWEYMPTVKQINDLRNFIHIYYKNDFYLELFNFAVKTNAISIKNFMRTYNLTNNIAYKKRLNHIIIKDKIKN